MSTTTIDLGNGKSVPRHHLPKNMSVAFDQASSALEQVQASIRKWMKPLYAMQAPTNVSGTIQCIAPGQTGRFYDLGEPGGALLIDQRDLATVTKLGFTAVPSAQPTADLRVGLVFLDMATGEYLRWDGSTWAAVTLS